MIKFIAILYFFIIQSLSGYEQCRIDGQIDFSKLKIESTEREVKFHFPFSQSKLLCAEVKIKNELIKKENFTSESIFLIKDVENNTAYNLTIRDRSCELLTFELYCQFNTKPQRQPPYQKISYHNDTHIYLNWENLDNVKYPNESFYTLCYYRHDNQSDVNQSDVSYMPTKCHKIPGHRTNTMFPKSLFMANSSYFFYISLTDTRNNNRSSGFSDKTSFYIDSQEVNKVTTVEVTTSFMIIDLTGGRNNISASSESESTKDNNKVRKKSDGRDFKLVLIFSTGACCVSLVVLVVMVATCRYKNRSNLNSASTESKSLGSSGCRIQQSLDYMELNSNLKSKSKSIDDLYNDKKSILSSKKLKEEYKELNIIFNVESTKLSTVSFQTVSRQFNSAWDVGHALHVPGEIPEERYLVYQNNNTHKYTIDQSMNNIWRIVWEEGVHFMLTLAPSIKSANKQTDWLSDVNDTVIIEWETISMEKSDKKSKKHYRLSLTLSSVTDHRDNLVYTYQCKGHCSLITLSGDLSRDTSQERLVTELRFPHWPATKSATPARVRDFSSLLTTVNVLNCCEGPIFVRTDLDRATPCGIFVVCHRLLRQLIKSGVINNFSSSHHRINVFETCLNSRIGSQLPVNNWKEYKFIYKVIVDILESSNQEI